MEICAMCKKTYNSLKFQLKLTLVAVKQQSTFGPFCSNYDYILLINKEFCCLFLFCLWTILCMPSKQLLLLPMITSHNEVHIYMTKLGFSDMVNLLGSTPGKALNLQCVAHLLNTSHNKQSSKTCRNMLQWHC